jgi:hypothetical protein
MPVHNNKPACFVGTQPVLKTTTPSPKPVSAEPKGGVRFIPQGSSDTQVARGRAAQAQLLNQHGANAIHQWLHNAPPEHYGSYADAAEKLLACANDPSITEVHLDQAEHLQNLPVLPAHLQTLKLGLGQATKVPLIKGHHLRALDLSDNRHLSENFDLTPYPSLVELNMADCESMPHAPDLLKCSELRVLNMNGWLDLRDPPVLTGNPALEVFELSHCRKLKTAPDFSANHNLHTLGITHLAGLSKPPTLPTSSALRHVDFEGCSSLADGPDLSGASRLVTLSMRNCSYLFGLPKLPDEPQLTSVDLGGCVSVTQADALNRCEKLTSVNLQGNRNLSGALKFKAPELAFLNVHGCVHLDAEPDVSACPKLLEYHGIGGMRLK